MTPTKLLSSLLYGEEAEEEEEEEEEGADAEEAPTESTVGAFLRTGATPAKPGAQADTDGPLHVTVLPANVLAVGVYRECSYDTVQGAASLVRLGISARELLSALEVCSVPPEKREDTRKRVRVMERAALAVFNERASRRMDQLRSATKNKG